MLSFNKIHSSWRFGETMANFEGLYTNKTVVVTGAGKGVGRALATELNRLGATVYAVTRSQADLDSLVKECGNVKPIQLDLSDWDETKRVLTEKIPDSVDILINNAGMLDHQSHLEVTSELFDKIFNVNVKALLNVTQVCVGKMIKSGTRGVVVNISSDGSIRPDPEYPIYCASKCAVDSFTKTMAVEFGKHKIRVVSIHPGWIKTPMTADVAPKSQEEEEEWKKIYAGRFPLNEIFIPIEQVVNTILFIGSDLVGMMTGSGVLIDGGLSAT